VGDQRGFSLISVLSIAAALAVVMMVMASTVMNFSRLQNAAHDKLDTMALSALMNSTVSSAACTCMLNPANNTGNSTPLSFTPGTPMALDHLYSACDALSRPVMAIATAGQAVPGANPTLTVSGVSFTNVEPSASGNPLEFDGELQVTFSNPGRTPLRPVSLPVQVLAAGAGPPYSVQSCLGAAGAANMSEFSASGSYVVPGGVSQVHVTVIGGGGGGGGASAANAFSGGGGGAGGYAEAWVAVNPGDSVAVVVGGGGLGGAVSGAAGGTSSFGAVTATGGAGGTGDNSDSAGGAGGTGTGPQLNLPGGMGASGNPNDHRYPGGQGGHSAFGGGGRSSDTSAGIDGTAPGSGGGGAWGATLSGGNGAAGTVIIRTSL